MGKEVERNYKDVLFRTLKKCETLKQYGTELIEMLFKELTREEDLEISRLYGYDAGLKEGEKSGFTKGEKCGEQKAALEITRSMKKEKIAADMIARITGLTMAEINAL